MTETHTKTRANDTVPAAPWQTRLAGLTLGPMRRFGGLCLYPLIGDDLSTMPYRILDEALTAGMLTIAELGEGGTVPELAVTNRGDVRVLIVDGEELVGAKQNRIVNTSVLVEAHRTLRLPVSCVEAGRWRGETAQFSSGGSQYNARGRQKKIAEVSDSLLLSGRPVASQSRVWSDIHTKLDRLGVSSKTGALHDATVAYGADLHGYQVALASPLPRQVGAAFALGGSLIGLGPIRPNPNAGRSAAQTRRLLRPRCPGRTHRRCAPAARRGRFLARKPCPERVPNPTPPPDWAKTCASPPRNSPEPLWNARASPCTCRLFRQTAIPAPCPGWRGLRSGGGRMEYAP